MSNNCDKNIIKNQSDFEKLKNVQSCAVWYRTHDLLVWSPTPLPLDHELLFRVENFCCLHCSRLQWLVISAKTMEQ